jgi:hypothetical protein
MEQGDWTGDVVEHGSAGLLSDPADMAQRLRHFDR